MGEKITLILAIKQIILVKSVDLSALELVWEKKIH